MLNKKPSLAGKKPVKNLEKMPRIVDGQPRQRVGINPPPRFIFDRESTKEFGGMVIDRSMYGSGKQRKAKKPSVPKVRPVKDTPNRRRASTGMAE